MIKYKIVSTVVDHLDEDEADLVLQQMKIQNPDNELEILKYNWSTVAKRLGRDPDLH